MRIAIIGLSGSGKTTLAKKLSERYGVPHIHIDRFWFEAGGLGVGHSAHDAARREAVRQVVREKILASHNPRGSWISDGFYFGMAPEVGDWAEHIIFLDIPLWRRLLNHARRISKPTLRHKELTWWHEIFFFYDMVRRTIVQKPKLLRSVERLKTKVTTLQSWDEIEAWINLYSKKQRKLNNYSPCPTGRAPKGFAAPRISK